MPTVFNRSWWHFGPSSISVRVGFQNIYPAGLNDIIKRSQIQWPIQTKLCDIFRGHKWWRKQKFGAPMTSWKGFNWRHKFNVVNRSLKFNLKPDQRDWHFTSDNKIGDTPFLHIFMRLAWTKLLSTMGHQDYATCRVKTKKTKLMPVTGCVVTGNLFLVTNPRKHHWTRHVQASDTCYLRLGWFAPW